MKIQHIKQGLLVILCLGLFLSACSPVGNRAAPAEQEPTTAASTKPIANTPTTIPNTPTAIPTSSLSQEELKEKWRTPISAYALISGICETTRETVTKQKNGETGDAQLSGELLGIRLMIGVTNGALKDWTPSSDHQPYKDTVLSRLNNINAIVELWTSGASTTETIEGDIKRECEALEKEVQDLVSTALNEGLERDTLEEIGQELQESMSSAAQEEATAEPEVIEPESTEPGLSRKFPVAASDVLHTPNWEIQVIDFKRGEEAWQMISAANPYNETAPEGLEYVLVNVKVKNTSTDEEERSISSSDFKITGGKNIRYNPAYVVPPNPVLDASLFPGGEAEGWISMLAGQNETNLILIFEELLNFDDDAVRYIALDDGASVSIPEHLKNIQPTDVGTTRANPGVMNDVVITEDWELAVLEVIRGDEAWQRIQEANMYNEPAENGMEYLLVRVRVHYIGLENEPIQIDRSSFKSSGSANVVYDPPSVVAPNPVLDAHLYPDGVMEGWVPLIAQQGETNLLLLFEPIFDFSDVNRRFIKLEP